MVRFGQVMMERDAMSSPAEQLVGKVFAQRLRYCEFVSVPHAKAWFGKGGIGRRETTDERIWVCRACDVGQRRVHDGATGPRNGTDGRI
jgi:hypothetical protein